MGILLKAREAKLDRHVALKLLSPQIATNATARERFLREARAAAKLEHPNILPIYAVHDGEVPYFAMPTVAPCRPVLTLGGHSESSSSPR